ncbi:MAG: PEP-CTERM sorting domain-containing protein [Terriglobia bacterium]
MAVPVGTPFTVTEGLALGAGSNWDEPTYTTSIDALSTASMYIDPVGTGITITSASGHDYRTLTGVPEPSTCVLLGSGLLGLVARTKRRQRK